VLLLYFNKESTWGTIPNLIFILLMMFCSLFASVASFVGMVVMFIKKYKKYKKSKKVKGDSGSNAEKVQITNVMESPNRNRLPSYTSQIHSNLDINLSPNMNREEEKKEGFGDVYLKAA
jgi:predicted membrane metal-binding protein